jgi:hypothetical protein
MDSLDKGPKLQNMDMRIGMCNIIRWYMAGSLMIVSKGLSKYKLHLVEVQEVRWERWN